MIALLFALFAVAMVLGYFGMQRFGYAVFAIAIVISIYWLNYHATSELTIQL